MEFVLLSVFILSLRPCYQQWYILYILYLVVLYIAQQRTQTIVVPFTYISLKRGVLRFSFPFYFSFRLTLTSSRASLVLFRPSFRPSFFGFSRASPLLSAYITFSSTLRTTNTIVTILTFHLTTLLVSPSSFLPVSSDCFWPRSSLPQDLSSRFLLELPRGLLRVAWFLYTSTH